MYVDIGNAIETTPGVSRDSLDRLDAMEAACILYGELAAVSTFSQPAVEWGKRAARGLLGGGHFEEAAAVADKQSLGID